MVVEGEDRYPCPTFMDDLHLNPVRARRIKPKQVQDMLGFAWSSLASDYARAPKRLVKGWEVAAILKAKGLSGLKGTDPRRRWLAEVLGRRTVVSQERVAEKWPMKSVPSSGTIIN